MALNVLPPELLLQIATDLDPYSTLELAVTCKGLHKLFESALTEHTRLSSKYKVIDCERSQEHSHLPWLREEYDGHLIWSTLKEILEDPRKGWYVREINLAGRQYRWDTQYHLDLVYRTSRPEHVLAVPPREDQAIFLKAVQALGDLYPVCLGHRDGSRTDPEPEKLWTTFAESLETSISSGWDDAIISILIHHVPLLKTIRITEHHTKNLETMLQWIASTYKDPDRKSQLPFQHLRHASIAHWDTENACSPDWACLFLSLPTLQAFAAHAMGGGITTLAENIYAPEDAQPGSNVKELFLSRCHLNHSDMKVVLRGVKDLRTLYYTDGGVLVSPNEQYQPKRTIQMVAASVGHSLEELVMNQSEFGDPCEENYEDLSRVSLREFKKLKKLQCELHMLSPGDRPGIRGPLGDFDVRSILPESLQELQLQECFDDGEWKRYNEFFSVRHTATPNLTKVRVQNISGSGQTIGVIGDAPPPIEFHLRPLAKLLDGHGQH